MRSYSLALALCVVGCGTDLPGLTGGTDSSSSSGTEGTSGSADGLTMSGGMTSAPADTTQGVDDNPTTSGPASSSGVDSESGTQGEESSAGVTTNESSTGVSTTGDPGMDCGDGAIGMGEQCDGKNLQGFNCSGLGLGTGELTCDPVTCTFDTSMCMSDPSGTSS